jgi:hypothetical protein
MKKMYKKCHRGGFWRVPGMCHERFLVFVACYYVSFFFTQITESKFVACLL